jgi:NUMOD4 motif-containing protein
METWKPVAGYEGLYEVSDAGRVRRGAVLQPIAYGGGYLKVNLWKKNKCRPSPIHALVLEAFVGPRPAGQYGCHNNNIPGDNRRWNLRWDTPKANSADQIKHGTKRLADRHHNAKLTSDAVREIRATTKRGTGVILAKKFGVTDGTISMVRSRKIWA